MKISQFLHTVSRNFIEEILQKFFYVFQFLFIISLHMFYNSFIYISRFLRQKVYSLHFYATFYIKKIITENSYTACNS